MQPRLQMLFGGLTCAIAACAKASGTGGEGGDPGGEGGATVTSSTAASGGTLTPTATSSAATSTATGSDTTATTSTTSTAATTGSGPACAEDPCKLTVPQCGCPADEQCSANANGRVCVAAGKVGDGQACAGPDCGPGLLCVLASATVSTCAKFCSTDADCQAPGGLCILGLNDGGSGTVPGVIMCTENCDPATSAGCPVAGTSCQLAQEADGQMRWLTHCGGAAAGQQGDACTTSDDCAPKFGCFADPTHMVTMTCAKYCKKSVPNGCPAGTTCLFYTDHALLGAEEYGVCL